MTSLVGILCKDGVVIGADSSVTFDDGKFRTIEQQSEKIEIFGSNVIVAGTGSVGLGQRFCAIVSAAAKGNQLRGTHLDIAKRLCGATINDFTSTKVQPGNYGALVAFSTGNEAHLCEFGIRDFQPEFKTEKLWFVSLGSVQAITDSFLAFLRSVFWINEQPNVNDGIFAAKWTLEHAVEVNPGGVNKPICLAVIEQVKGRYVARKVPDEELQEHQQNIFDAKATLVDFRNSHKHEGNIPVPNVPKQEPAERNAEAALPGVEELMDGIPPISRTAAEPLVKPQEEISGNTGKGKRRRRH